MTALLHLEALHKMTPAPEELPKEEEYDFQAAIRIALVQTAFESLLQEFEFRPMRDAFMLDIVGNTVCADLLDYAQRDSILPVFALITIRIALRRTSPWSALTSRPTS